MITFLWSSVPYLTDIFTYISLVFNHKQQVLLLVDNQKKSCVAIPQIPITNKNMHLRSKLKVKWF